MYVTYDNNYRSLATAFAHAIRIAVETIHEPQVFEHLQMQQNFVKKFYSWEKKSLEWTTFLKGISNGK